MPEIKYFWLLTLSWPTAGGIKTITRTGTFNSGEAVSRHETLHDLIAVAQEEKGAPARPDVVEYILELDEVPR